MFAERALVARAEVTLAPAKAETYYPSGNAVSRPIHRQSRHPRASRPLSRHTRHHPSPIDTVHRTTSRKRVRRVRWTSPIDPHPIAPDPHHPGNPDRARYRSFARARAPLRKRSSATKKQKKIRRIFPIVSLSARRTHPRVPPRVFLARAFERMSSEPRAIDRSSASSSSRRLHARVVFTRASSSRR